MADRAYLTAWGRKGSCDAPSFAQTCVARALAALEGDGARRLDGGETAQREAEAIAVEVALLVERDERGADARGGVGDDGEEGGEARGDVALGEGVDGAEDAACEGMRFHGPELSGRTERGTSILQCDLSNH